MNRFAIILFLFCYKTILGQELPKDEKRMAAIQAISTYRNFLVLNRTEDLKQLAQLQKKWNYNEPNVELRQEIIFFISVFRSAYRIPTCVLLRRMKILYPTSGLIGKIDSNDVRIIARNSRLIDLIQTGVIESNYPFPLSRKETFYKELAFYDIKAGEKNS